MSEHEDSSDELVDSLLGTSSQSSSNDSLRRAVFAKTVGVIRFRRRLKKCALAASLVGCYLAGIATTATWRPARDARSQPSTGQVATGQEPASPSIPSPPEPVGSSDRQIVREKMSRAEVFRRSADRELLENGDVKSAVRNYKRLLNLPSAEQRAISPRQDNWLLMALKDARSKEMKHDRIEQD